MTWSVVKSPRVTEQCDVNIQSNNHPSEDTVPQKLFSDDSLSLLMIFSLWNSTMIAFGLGWSDHLGHLKSWVDLSVDCENRELLNYDL
ncbi:hypothetical protein TNCV_2207381 [Trichonephila clavipes]|uniref:Uncharacterized protein n=1 Tax=Trichonephila clavipes TaxID=2585209 RepID=A0A8X6S9I8_TRICX|nr:hypothetical protein TNCV_2207381 [Trichonephila clavipes]